MWTNMKFIVTVSVILIMIMKLNANCNSRYKILAYSLAFHGISKTFSFY